MLTPASSIAIIGFGDTGRRIALPFAVRGVAVRAYDRLLDDAGSHLQMTARIEAAGVDPARSPGDAMRGARLVIAAAGHAATSGVVQSVAPLLHSGQIYLELGDCSTPTHRDHAAVVERCGAHYIAGQPDDALLLSGARAAVLAAALETLGIPARAVAGQPQGWATGFPAVAAKAAPPRADATSRAVLQPPRAALP